MPTTNRTSYRANRNLSNPERHTHNVALDVALTAVTDAIKARRAVEDAGELPSGPSLAELQDALGHLQAVRKMAYQAAN